MAPSVVAPAADIPRIKRALAGKCILVTGGTGFMGKVLLEKLLRSCPDVGDIYVLVRAKRGVAVQDRLSAIFKAALFEPLLKERPEAVSKVRAVAGDCSALRLGLSASDEATLVDNVSYVFHAAATIRFDDPLQSAVLLNTRGTREVVELCKKMKKLEVLQYVSTTYCFTNVPVLKEQPYPSDLDWRTVIRLAETQDQATLDAVSRKILGFQPNTYTFSKALAENIINDHRDDIPIIIYRPAVVISSMREPFAGWLDNLNGPFGIWAGVLKGLLRFSYGNVDVALSYTPVDWAIRGMIVCAVARAARSQALSSNPDQVDVVNMEGSQYEKKLTYGTQITDLKLLKNCAVQPLRYPNYVMTTCFAYYWLGTLCSQVPYGIGLDLLLRLAGKKPRALAIYRKIVAANAALAYFMLNEFPIETGKMNKLHFALHVDDRTDFGMTLDDPTSHFIYNKWEYFEAVIRGAHKYVLNEEATPEETVSRLRKLYVLDVVINLSWVFLLYLTIGRFLISRLYQPV